ncbi:MAG: alanine racemase [bacterium]
MQTWIEVNKKAIEYNLKQIRQKIGRDVLLMPVIKANAYGHGFLETAKICNQNKEVDRICVANSDEALRLIELTKKPIQILSFYDLDKKILLKLAKNAMIFPVYDQRQAKILDKVGDNVRKKIKIHLKIDTGTSRLGILPNNLVNFTNDIKNFKNLNIEGVFSHFSSSEEDREVTIQQLEIFNKATNLLSQQGINPAIRHITCSAATILYPESHFDAVRIGISLYGLHPSDQANIAIKLKPVLSWHTKIIQVKKVPSQTKISYDCTYTTNRPTKLAILPIGYWDGFDRGLSNKGLVLIKGIKCPILGRVCMNLSIVDITNIPEVNAGEQATLIGTQGHQTITAQDMAKWAGTINYEIIDRINPLLPRIIK